MLTPEQRPTLTISNDGRVLTETIEDIELPADYSFATINDYVHDVGRQYEELQCLALGMASHIDAQQARIAELEQALADATEARKEAQRTLQQVQQQMQRAGVIATKDAYRRGVEAEREACAQMCDDMETARNEPKWAIWTAQGAVSAAIRARTDTWPEDASDYASRIAVIGQNGNDGLHYPEGEP